MSAPNAASSSLGAARDVRAPRHAFLTESAIFAERLLTRWFRNPLVPLQSILLPTILLIIYYMMISRSMARLTGNSSLDTVVAMCAVAGGMSGALAAALSIPDERDSGLLSRFYVMPVHRFSALAGTLAAEAARTLVATLVITTMGLVLGLRFHGGPLAAVGFILIPVGWVTVFATLIVVVALRVKSRPVLTWISTASLGLVFGSSAVAPIEAFPTFVRPIVGFQPMSPTITAMVSFARGTIDWGAVLGSCAWIGGLGLVAGLLAVRNYRVAARSEG